MSTYHVKVGGKSSASGTFSNPFGTIEQALARARSHPGGDDIEVWYGKWKAVYLGPGDSGLDLIGHGARIDANGARVGVSIHEANWTSVSGFEVYGAKGTGISSDGAHHVTIKDNDVHDNGAHGIAAGKGDYIRIQHNTVQDNWGGRTGLDFKASSGISIHHLKEYRFGQDVKYRVDVSWNKVVGNGTDGGTDGYGAIIDQLKGKNSTPYDEQVRFAYNHVVNNGNSGLYVYMSENVEVTENYFQNNGRDETKKTAVAGIGVHTVKDIDLKGNTVIADNPDDFAFFAGGRENARVTFENEHYYVKGHEGFNHVVMPFFGSYPVMPTEEGNHFGVEATELHFDYYVL